MHLNGPLHGGHQCIHSLRLGRVYNTEAHGLMHDVLSQHRQLASYVASEYVCPSCTPGVMYEAIGGRNVRHEVKVARVVSMREPHTWAHNLLLTPHSSRLTPRPTTHQDLQRISFRDESLDMVISAEVFEHVPDPYRAHREIFRVLAPGGSHVFTVPADINPAANDTRLSMIDGEGKLWHRDSVTGFDKPPLYHGDPMHPKDGILVFTIFGARQMLERLCAIGFHVKVQLILNKRHGVQVPGPGGVEVWTARKPVASL